MAHDNVNHPAHYTSHPSGVECIEITERLDFCRGNAVKYVWRHRHKNGVEDLRKALWYVDRALEAQPQFKARPLDLADKVIAEIVAGRLRTARQYLKELIDEAET